MTLKSTLLDKSSWKTKKLIVSFAFVSFLIFSWQIPSIHLVWDSIDKSFFRWVNGFIATSSFWQGFWAISNHNISDWLHDVVMLSFFAIYLYRKNEKPLSFKISELIFLCLLMGFTIILINRYLCLTVLEIQRKSPSLMCDFTILLSQKVSWIKTKGQSFTSYPGDHGTTALMFAMGMWHLMGKKEGFIAFIYSIYWILPRLVTGCHWLTDVIMGSFAIAVCVMSLAIYTPFKDSFCHLLSKLFQKYTKPKSSQ